MKKYSLFFTLGLGISIIFNSCLEEVPLACPSIIEVNKLRVSAGEIVEIKLDILPFQNAEGYKLKIGDHSDIEIIEVNTSQKSLVFEIPQGLQSGEIELDLSSFSCEDNESAQSFVLIYEPRVHNIEVLGVPGEAGSNENEFNFPSDIDILNGLVYVTDTNNGYVKELDFDEGSVQIVAGNPAVPFCKATSNALNTNLRDPTGLEIAPSTNTLYVSAPPCTSLFEITLGGGAIKKDLSLLSSPIGVEINEDGEILVVDHEAGRIFRFDENDQLDSYAGSINLSCDSEDNFINAAKLCLPFDMVYDEERDILYFTEFKQNSSLRYIQNEAVSTIEPANNSFDLEMPAGITIDHSGNLYIASYGGRKIIKYEVLSNTFLDMDIPFTDFGFNGLAGPRGITYDKNQNLLYIADTQGHAVYKIEFI